MKPPRTFTAAIDINATPDEVWRALTDAGELVRWFPLQARVTPGAGGKMFWGWDNHWAWESDIDVWEPGKRLRLLENGLLGRVAVVLPMQLMDVRRPAVGRKE